MKAYETIKLIECPDMGDLRTDGRGRNGKRAVFHNASSKAATRRSIKRADKARAIRAAFKAEERA